MADFQSTEVYQAPLMFPLTSQGMYSSKQRIGKLQQSLYYSGSVVKTKILDFYNELIC